MAHYFKCGDRVNWNVNDNMAPTNGVIVCVWYDTIHVRAEGSETVQRKASHEVTWGHVDKPKFFGKKKKRGQSQDRSGSAIQSPFEPKG